MRNRKYYKWVGEGVWGVVFFGEGGFETLGLFDLDKHELNVR